MDNRETEANNGDVSQPSPARIQQRRARVPQNNSRARYNNWASSVTRAPTNQTPASSNNSTNCLGGSRPSNSQTTDNRDTYNRDTVRARPRHSNAQNQTNPFTINNDLSNPRSNEALLNFPPVNTRMADNSSNNSVGNSDNIPELFSSTVDNGEPSFFPRGANGAAPNNTRRRHVNNARGGGASSRLNQSSNTRNFNNSTSPMRGGNPRQHAPPLRLRGNNSPTRNLDTSVSVGRHGRSSNRSTNEADLGLRMGRLPSDQALSGEGTEDEPFLLTSGGLTMSMSVIIKMLVVILSGKSPFRLEILFLL